MTVAAVTQAGSRLLGLKSSWFFRRGFAADHHGPARVNMWEAPGSPRRWKEEHFVFASLAGWGAIFFGGYKAATGGSKKKAGHAPAAKPAAATEKPKRESKLPSHSARPEHKPAALGAPAKKPEQKPEPKPSSKPPSHSARPEHKPAAVVAPAKKPEQKPEPKPSTKPEPRKKDAGKEPEASVKQPPKKEGPKAKKIPPSGQEKQKKE